MCSQLKQIVTLNENIAFMSILYFNLFSMFVFFHMSQKYASTIFYSAQDLLTDEIIILKWLMMEIIQKTANYILKYSFFNIIYIHLLYIYSI